MENNNDTAKINFSMLKRWQKRKLIFNFLLFVVISTLFLSIACYSLWKDKTSEDEYWVSGMQMSDEVEVRQKELSGNEVKVLTGTYVEDFKSINIKDSSYSVTFLAWFRWEGDKDLDMANNFRVYKGSINSKEIIKDKYENGVHYQAVRVDATVSKNFWTKRFPLESHQLRIYLETNYNVAEVVLEPDLENSGVNRSLSVSGYELVRHQVGAYGIQYDNTRGDPDIGKAVVSSEFVTALEINRDGFGLYLKCFLALLGTLSWVLITLYICTYHRVDPLGMIPGALFGTVANIMVGANLVPDALQIGLLEYVNLYSIFIILFATWIIISINRIRNKYEDKEYAKFYGTVMFYTVLVFTLLAHAVLPLTAFLNV